MGRVFVDITELVGWRGKLTGVPRVMNELARRFLENDDIQFVYWNKPRKALEAVSFTPIVTDVISNDGPVVPQGLAERAKVLVRKSRYASRTVEIVKGGVVAIRSGASKGERVVLGDGDTMIILADWHGSDPNFILSMETAKSSGAKIIQFCYDLLPIVAPQYSGHSTKTLFRYVRRVYSIADVIITISDYTKRDLEAELTKLGIRVPPVEVIRLGDDFQALKPKKPAQEALKPLMGSKEPFALCVGTIEARKNHALIYYAYKLAGSRGISLPKMVIVGRIGWLSKDIYVQATTDPETKDKLIFVKDISDGELAWLYGHALFSVYPSFYEGWGLPVAESIAYGLPCLASNTSSIPEIAGDLLDYFSPYSSEELLGQMVKLTNDVAREKAVKKMKTYKLTSWDSTFASVSAIIDKYGTDN